MAVMTLPLLKPKNHLTKWRGQLAALKRSGRSGPRPRFVIEDNRKPPPITLFRTSIERETHE
jgi:hypothetical protein